MVEKPQSADPDASGVVSICANLREKGRHGEKGTWGVK